MTKPATPPFKQERAEQLYARHLTERKAGSKTSIERLTAEHEDLAAELQEAHLSWSRASGIYRFLKDDNPVSYGHAREVLDPDADPAISVDAATGLGSADSTSSRLMRQLEASASRLQRFEILGEVARGGMGKILKVWDPELRRQLAMKVATFPGASGSHSSSEERSLARFLEEAQITGQLDHPCIVPVHEMGLDATGRVCFTMQLVRGRDLAAIFDLVGEQKDGWNLTRAVRVLLKVAEAMAYAHNKRVLHRDLKPANIMIGRFGEVYVMDWGLAHVRAESPSPSEVLRSATRSFIRTDRRDSPTSDPLHTHDGDVMGTPAYMPPEQARGDIHAIDERSDVYSLGAILYHLLAGHVPYLPAGRTLSAIEVWEALRERGPEPLAETDAPAELAAICDKAMAREPSERYQSMGDLASDLGAYLDGHVVRAFETGAAAELRKWTRRNRPTAIASAAAILLAMGGLTFASWIQSQANRELGAKNVELRLARDQSDVSASEARRERDRADDQTTLAHARGEEAIERAAEAARERDAADRVVLFLVDLFRSPDPALARGETMLVKEILDRGAERIALGDLDPLVAARLRDAMGEANQALGLFDHAEPLLEAAYEDYLGSLGPKHRDTLDSMNHLAELYVWRGRHKDAERIYKRALRTEEEEFAEDDPLILSSLGGLATLYHSTGEYELSEEYRLRAMEGFERRLGADATETLDSLGELALLYRDTGRFDEAEDIQGIVLDARTESLGADHPDTLRAEHRLASSLFFRGDFGEAKPRLERVLAEMRRVLGVQHPTTLGCANDLALVLQSLDEIRAGADLLRETLPGFQAAYGPSHLLTLGTQNNLAVQLTKLGEYAEAAAMLRDALQRFAESNREDHPSALATINSLGYLFLQQAQYAEALEQFERALEGARRLYGEAHPNVRRTEESVAYCLFNLGDYERALEHIELALDGAEESLRQLFVPLRSKILSAIKEQR